MQNIMDEKQHLQAFDSGDSYNAYEYMGSHKVGDGGCYVLGFGHQMHCQYR